MPKSSQKPSHSSELSHPLRGIRERLRSLYHISLIIFIFGIPQNSDADEDRASFLAENSSKISKTIRIHPLMPSSALGNAAITSILKQKNGQLWVSEQSGLHFHDGQRLVSFTTLQNGSNYAPSTDISSITEDQLGNIWAASRSTGITKHNKHTGIFANVEGLPNNSVSQLVHIGNGKLLYIHNGKIYGYQTKSDLQEQNPKQYFQEVGTASKIQLKDNESGIIFSDLGIFEFNIEEDTLISVSPAQLKASSLQKNERETPVHYKAPAALNTASPIEIFELSHLDPTIDENQNILSTVTALHRDLFFAGTDGGLYVFNNDGSFVGIFNTQNSGLTNDHITHLYSDGEVLWVGTYQGLCYVKISDFELYDKSSDLISNEILNFFEDHAGKIWVGTYDGIFQFDTKKATHRPLEASLPELQLVDKRVMALSITDSEILIGTRKSGLIIIDLKSGEFISHNLESNQDLEVTEILRISETSFLVSSFNEGLYLITKARGEDKFRWLAKKIANDTITVLEEHAGNVIAANEKSFYFFDIDSLILKEINLIFPHPENHPIITALHSYSSKDILIGTQSHGMFSAHFDFESKNLLEAKPELREIQSYSTGIWAIESDKDNRLWIATSNGLFLYSPELIFLRRYSVADGLQANKFNFGASFKDKDGFLYFGGSRGYNRFHPAQIPSSTSPPSIDVTGIKISNKEIPATQDIRSIESIILSHKDLFITFEFSTLDYTDPESTRYRHKLVGFDKDWVDIGDRGSATYTSLPPGEYVFRVQAVNSAGIWNFDGLSIGLEVMPAPWNTWWANTLYALAAIVILAGAFRYQRNNMLRDQDLARAKEMQRIADRVADDLQDQMEFQANFGNSMHHYNKQLLYWTKFCTDTTAEYESANTALAYDRIRFRLDVLSLIQDSLFYRGEQLYAELPRFINLLVKKLHDENPEGCERLNSVNDVEGELVPAAQAIPIAIMFAELFDNSLKHAFARNSESRFIRFSLTITPNTSFNSDTFHLVYQDNGYGIPPGLSFESPESAGFAIIQHAAERLGGEIEISDQDRNLISASFSIPWS